MSALKLTGIQKRYGGHAVVDGLELSVEAGEFVSLLGPSGCGKTTLLRIIAGLAEADAGTVVVGGVDMTRMPAHKRNIGVVFQSYALFPHLTVAENIAFGLKARKESRPVIDEAVKGALKAVRLDAFADRPIAARSGGQQQRVAVARAIATRPRLILLDESLSALDRKRRESMQIELRHMLRDAGMTAIFVTHDQEEALVMSDRIAVMNLGRIEQLGAPEHIYARPATEFALNFVGLSAQWRGHVAVSDAEHLIVSTNGGQVTAVPSPASAGLAQGQTVLLGVRPERIEIRLDPDPFDASGLDGKNRMNATVRETVYRGSNRLIYFKLANVGPTLMAEIPAHLDLAPAAGDTIGLAWAYRDTLVFPSTAPADVH
ncbi:ABC transporter ATP-binding protein [soil metagenome]